MSSQFFSDHELYFDFLKISEDEIPMSNDSIDKLGLLQIVEQRFRKLARVYHPDFGGSDENFKFLLKCKQVLLGSEMSGSNNFSLSVHEANLSEFNKNTIAAKIGDQIFELISSWKDELEIKPIFRPTDPTDCYEWIFNTKIEGVQLCLNVQDLSREYAEISSATHGNKNLNVVVCIFIPSNKLAINNIQYDNSVELKFNDKIFLESSNSDSIFKYLSGYENIKVDLEKVFEGKFVSKKNEIKIKNVNSSIKADAAVLDYLQKIKLFSVDQDDSAADFLERI